MEHVFRRMRHVSQVETCVPPDETRSHGVGYVSRPMEQVFHGLEHVSHGVEQGYFCQKWGFWTPNGGFWVKNGVFGG